MEYSCKMVLAPQEVYDAMHHEKTGHQNECTMKSDDKLHNILEDP